MRCLRLSTLPLIVLIPIVRADENQAIQETILEIDYLRSRHTEDASFVKFLVERFGKERFLPTHRQLLNSDNSQGHQRNRQTLERIYRATLAELDQRWQKGIRHGNL